MESFTSMSDEGIAAVIHNQRNSGEPYTFTLGVTEFNNFRKVLDKITLWHPNVDLSNWAEHFANSIAFPEFVLNNETFENMVYSLRYAWFNYSQTPYTEDKELGEWAGDFLSGIALTLDVEFV